MELKGVNLRELLVDSDCLKQPISDAFDKCSDQLEQIARLQETSVENVRAEQYEAAVSAFAWHACKISIDEGITLDEAVKARLVDIEDQVRAGLELCLSDMHNRKRMIEMIDFLGNMLGQGDGAADDEEDE